MKIKSDFVTNSSSTSFFFIFNGKHRKKLFKLIEKYSDKFNLIENWGTIDDIWLCNSKFIIVGIDMALNKKSKWQWETCKIKPLFTIISDHEERLKNLKIDMALKTNSGWLNEIYKDQIEQEENLLKDMKESLSKGLKNCLEIEFGDNHGHISGSNASSCMDYLKPEIKENDFYLLHESKR